MKRTLCTLVAYAKDYLQSTMSHTCVSPFLSSQKYYLLFSFTNDGTRKTYITSQNHGFAVDANTIINASQPIEITHRNLNDDTVEGIRTKDNLISCVQYHPESSPGPHDSRYLFDNFLTTIQLFDK